ncbi:restriction endonuclease subunit S [Ruminococcus sp. CLA-AA-H200]|uniref:Restriction endonuclease subunit S n=1 Tax=Ruminococcus turbiniformis TaxID=2881258 RepID=A0ABS8G4Y8_9FIRM|nr:restriction endonuclease subunit S [Ruminococcus turbiniformis]MCC2255989.1 restriction endonuclease subunit S [Ruminococcus turbiniformis]
MIPEIKQRIEQICQGNVPEGYKQTGQNIIPQGWKKLSFEQVAMVRSGLVSPKTEPYSSMLYIGPENIEKDTGRIQNVRFATELGLISGKFYFDAFSIVYSKIRPNLNKVCVPDFEGICSADCYSIKVRENIDRNYLFALMLSHQFYKRAVACSMRTGMPKINQDDLNTICLVFPDNLEEQQKISAILTTQDKVIELKEKRLAEKQRQKKYFMQQLLTSKRRLPGFSGEWKTERLGKLFLERKETNCEGLEMLAITGTQGIIPRKELDLKNNSSNDKSKYLRVCVGDIGYNTMRMWQGVSAYSNYDGIVSPAYTILKPNPSINAKYFAYLFKMPEIIFLFYRFSQGLVDDTRSLKYENFKKIKVFYPPDIKEQTAIVEVLSTADREIDLLRQNIEQENQKKKALMQLLLTGIVRVKT